MNNELSQVGDWWILIRNLTYHRPPAFVLAVLKGMLRTSRTSVCSSPLGDCNASEGACCGTRWHAATQAGDNTTAFLMQTKGQKKVPAKMMGKGDSLATPPPSRAYQQVWWIVFILSIVNRSWHFFLLLFFFLMTLSILLSEMSWWSAWSYKGGRENINLHLLSPAESCHQSSCLD